MFLPDLDAIYRHGRTTAEKIANKHPDAPAEAKFDKAWAAAKATLPTSSMDPSIVSRVERVTEEAIADFFDDEARARPRKATQR